MSKLTLRRIYLYLFSLVGLTLIIIGAVGLINLTLQLTFFRSALKYRYGYMQPPYPYFLESVKFEENIQKIELTEDQKKALESWKQEYDRYVEEGKKIAYLPYVADSLTRNISLLIVGIPVYIYHWGLVKKEHLKEEA